MKYVNRICRAFSGVAAVYGLLCILNVFLGAHIWFPRFEWRWIFIPLPEAAAAAVILLAIAGLFHSPGPSRNFPRSSVHNHHSPPHSPLSASLLLLLFTVLFLLLCIFSILEAFFQHVYLRTFDIRANIPLISHFFNMLFNTEIFSRPLMLILPGAAGLGLTAALFWALFRHTVSGLGRLPRSPAITAAVCALLISLAVSPARPAALRLSDQLFFYRPAFDTTAVPRFDDSASYGAYTNTRNSGLALPGIRDVHIHLCIVESYGTTVFTNQHHFNRIEAFYNRQETLLRQEGFSSFSHAYDSTAFGGTSWLADATILSGIEIRSQSHYDSVVKGGTKNILHLLRKAGYHTILSAPGTKFMTDEYTGFYDYDTYILYDDFEYHGPFFTFGKLPDQYQLHFIYSRVIDHTSQQPRFVQYILCSSHVPWNFIPPYISSWSGFNEGRIFYNHDNNTWYDNSWALGSELFEGYAHSIRYSLESVFGYARTHLDENDLLIVIGDHQPKFPVSEKGAGFGVPVHLIGKNRSILLPFQRFGYEEGLLPPRTEKLSGLERFLVHFMTVAEGTFLQPRPTDAPLSIPK